MGPLVLATPRNFLERFFLCLPGWLLASFISPHIQYTDVKHTLLSAGLLDLVGGTDTDETEVRLEFLHGLVRIVHQGEASALATTVLRTEAEDVHLILVGLVEVGELLAEFILGDVGAVGVEDVTVVDYGQNCGFSSR